MGLEGGLDEVVGLKAAVDGPVRVRGVHAVRVEVPYGRLAHDVQAPGPEDEAAETVSR